MPRFLQEDAVYSAYYVARWEMKFHVFNSIYFKTNVKRPLLNEYHLVYFLKLLQDILALEKMSRYYCFQKFYHEVLVNGVGPFEVAMGNL